MKRPFSDFLRATTKKFILPENPYKLTPNSDFLLKPSPNFTPHQKENTQKTIDSNCGLGNTPQTIRNGKKNPLAGKILTFLDPWKSTTLDQKDADDFSSVLSCGLGGASSENALFESYHPISQLMNNGNKLMVYSSLTDCERREERFRKGLPYYFDESYINVEESENFYNQVLKNRFFDKDDKLKNPQDVKKIILFGFSIGHRENKSHINFLHQKITEALEREGKDTKQTSEYFNKIALVNIASPLNWEGKKLPKEIISSLDNGSISVQEAQEYFNKNHETKNLFATPNPSSVVREIGYRSLFDMGTAKPVSDFNNFHCNEELFDTKIFVFTRPNSKLEEMYLLGKGKVDKLFSSNDPDDGYKTNKLGHNLADYAFAIYSNAETLVRIMELQSNSLVQFSKSNLTRIIFDKDRTPTDDDNKTLKEDWHRQLQDVAATQLYQNFAAKERKGPN